MSDSESKIDAATVLGILLAVTIITNALTLLTTIHGVNQNWRVDAVKRGYGTWVVSGDGETEFKWREEKEGVK